MFNSISRKWLCDNCNTIRKTKLRNEFGGKFKTSTKSTYFFFPDFPRIAAATLLCNGHVQALINLCRMVYGTCPCVQPLIRTLSSAIVQTLSRTHFFRYFYVLIDLLALKRCIDTFVHRTNPSS